jgi:hypothetical protein
MVRSSYAERRTGRLRGLVSVLKRDAEARAASGADSGSTARAPQIIAQPACAQGLTALS